MGSRVLQFRMTIGAIVCVAAGLVVVIRPAASQTTQTPPDPPKPNVISVSPSQAPLPTPIKTSAAWIPTTAQERGHAVSLPNGWSPSAMSAPTQVASPTVTGKPSASN